jgi:hypothetical protein
MFPFLMVLDEKTKEELEQILSLLEHINKSYVEMSRELAEAQIRVYEILEKEK